MSIETVRLEKWRVGAMQRMSRRLLTDPSAAIDPFIGAESGHAVLILGAAIWGHRVTDKPIEISYPADWLQSFKARWFPKWALRKWPVVNTVRRVEFRAHYPEFQTVPDQEYCIIQVLDGKEEGTVERSRGNWTMDELATEKEGAE